MKKLSYILAICALGLCCGSAWGQAINCPPGTGFNTNNSGPCSVALGGFINFSQVFNVRGNVASVSGGALTLETTGATHAETGLIFQSPVNVQAFTSTFTFIPNDWNLAFVLQNSTAGGSCPGSGCQSFGAGAGFECGFTQYAGGPNIPPTNTFGLCIDTRQGTGSGAFDYSNVQRYESLQTTIRPPMTTAGYLAGYEITALSTSPVSLTQPGVSGSCFQTVGGTCDTFSATVVYDGSTLTFTMFDVTAGGACPGASCFTQTWSNVNIPSIVGSNTAYPTITASTGLASTIPMVINSLVYAVNTPTGTPTYTAYNANSTYNIGTVSAASPVYSVAPGSYSGTQSVSITTSSTPNNYICYTLSATPLTPSSSTRYPHPDNNGGCVSGTLYTGAISVASTSTLYAMAGSNNSSFGVEPVSNPTGLGPPSTLVAATYTIGGGGTAASPTASPLPRFYTSTQNIALASVTVGATICYTIDGSTPLAATPGTCSHGTTYSSAISVAATTTIKAIATLTGLTNSSVQSFLYTITAPPIGSFMFGGYQTGTQQ